MEGLEAIMVAPLSIHGQLQTNEERKVRYGRNFVHVSDTKD